MEKEEPKRIPVRVIGTQGESCLVEWRVANNYLHRAYLPAAKVKEESCLERDLAKGIPYGLPWEQWIVVTATPESIANEFRRQGVWEWKDINKPALVAANTAFDLGEFLRRVSQEVGK